MNGQADGCSDRFRESRAPSSSASLRRDSMNGRKMRTLVLGCIAISASDIAGCAVEQQTLEPPDFEGLSSPLVGEPFETLPNLPQNACNNTNLPRSYGTNFPTPRDPYAFGWFNQSAIGWQGNWYPAFAYLSGSYFARGVPTTYSQGGTNYCGAMYSFGAYTYGLSAGQSPPTQSIQWTMDSGHLPALRTSFTRNNIAISITNFANRVVIGGNAFVLAYTRVSVTNNGSAAVTVPPGGSGPNLVRLTPVA